MKSTALFLALSMVFINSASLAFGQSFLCSPITAAAVFPNTNGTWGAQAVNSFEPHESLIDGPCRPPHITAI